MSSRLQQCMAAILDLDSYVSRVSHGQSPCVSHEQGNQAIRILMLPTPNSVANGTWSRPLRQDRAAVNPGELEARRQMKRGKKKPSALFRGKQQAATIKCAHMSGHAIKKGIPFLVGGVFLGDPSQKEWEQRAATGQVGIHPHQAETQRSGKTRQPHDSKRDSTAKGYHRHHRHAHPKRTWRGPEKHKPEKWHLGTWN